MERTQPLRSFHSGSWVVFVLTPSLTCIFLCFWVQLKVTRWPSCVRFPAGSVVAGNWSRVPVPRGVVRDKLSLVNMS